MTTGTRQEPSPDPAGGSSGVDARARAAGQDRGGSPWTAVAHRDALARGLSGRVTSGHVRTLDRVTGRSRGVLTATEDGGITVEGRRFAAEGRMTAAAADAGQVLRAYEDVTVSPVTTETEWGRDAADAVGFLLSRTPDRRVSAGTLAPLEDTLRPYETDQGGRR